MKVIAKTSIGLFFLLILLFIVHYSGGTKYVSLENIKYYSSDIQRLTTKYYVTSVLIYMLIYFIIVALSIPVVPVIMAGGFLFGTIESVLYSTIAATLGAMVSFLFLRLLLKPAIGNISQKGLSRYYSDRLGRFKKGLDEYGVFYLLLLHFMVIVPFFVINLLAVVAGISFWKFSMITFVGFLPCAFVYSFAGKNLLSIRSTSDAFSWNILLAIILLIFVAILPIIFEKIKRDKNF